MSAILLCIPGAMLAAVLTGVSRLLGPLALVTAIYAWVWLLFRPTLFIVRPGEVEVVWPLKRRTLPRSGIVSARMVDARQLKQETGWGARVGAGGLWGGFGWLWTQRRGIVQMYISRTDSFVWIERGAQRPWLITPEHPEEFLQSLWSQE